MRPLELTGLTSEQLDRLGRTLPAGRWRRFRRGEGGGEE